MSATKKQVAVAYCRVSTDEQAKEGLSVGVQETACRVQIEKDGLVFLKAIKDEGKSGGSLDRAGIKELLQLIHQKKVDAVYAIHSDRLARNTMDYLYLRDVFRKGGVTLKYLHQPTTDESAVSRTMDTVVASFNEMQRLVTSERVKASLNQKAEAGYFPSIPPVGYMNVKNPDSNGNRFAEKIIVQDPERALFVKEAFKLYATGNFNVYDLNDLMYEKGLRTRTGSKLAPSRFYDLLKNRIYLGEVHWGPIHVKGKHEPLIDETTFNRAQALLAENNKHACRRRKYTWLLNGFVWCRRHQKRYTAEWHMKKKLAYYHCSNRTGCGKYIEANKLEDAIAEKFKDLEFHPDFVELVLEKARSIFYQKRHEYENKRQSLVNRKTALEAKLKVAENKFLEEALSNEDFARIRGELEPETESIDEQVHYLKKQQGIRVDIAQEIFSFARNLFATYQKASPQMKRHYLNFFWDRFEVEDGVIITSVPSLLFKELLAYQQAAFKSAQEQENPLYKGDSLLSAPVIIKTLRLPLLDAFRTLDWTQIREELEQAGILGMGSWIAA